MPSMRCGIQRIVLDLESWEAIEQGVSSNPGTQLTDRRKTPA